MKSKYRKKNESETHYLLKQIALYYLYSHGYNCAAEEVMISSNNELGKKSITDTLGCKYNKNDLVFMSIEAKQSRSDYYNSFVSSADYNYIIIPKGLLTEKDKYVKHVGIIEVDLDLFEFNFRKNGNIDLFNPFKKNSVKITKQARKMKLNYFERKTSNGYNTRERMLKQIANRTLVEMIAIRHGFEKKGEQYV